VLAAEPGIGVGSPLVLEIGEKEYTWTVVGVAQVLGGPPNQVPVYVNYPYFARLTGDVNRASSLQLQLDPASGLSQDEAATILNERLEAGGFQVASTFTIAALRRFTGIFFDIVVYLLLAMGVLIAAVGALGLAGVMSTNVLERTREIGVMRAVGATGRAVRGIVIGEGALIGVLSWLIGLVLAIPISRLLSNAVGIGFLRTPLSYEFSVQGALIWLGAVLILSAAASLWPARNASRLSVREVLAYE
jgi:putative ABC transport system permease protein